MGIAVFAGMIGVTVFSLFLTPLFFVLLEKIGVRKPVPPVPAPVAQPA
jgi:multidrug efflux pump